MRFLPVRATFVAGPLSVLFLVAPVAAQGLPPGGARPSGPPAGAIAPSAVAPAPSAPAAAGTSVAVIDVAYIFKNHARFNQSMNDMKRDIEAFDAHMQEESKKLQKKQEELQTFGPSSPQFKKLDEELAKMKSDFQIAVQSKKRDFLEAEARALRERDVGDPVKGRSAVATVAPPRLAFGRDQAELLIVTQCRCRHGTVLGHLADVNQLIGWHLSGFAVHDLPNRSRANQVDVVPDGLHHHHAGGKIVSSTKERRG